jgi:hypothetical protein
MPYKVRLGQLWSNKYRLGEVSQGYERVGHVRTG